MNVLRNKYVSVMILEEWINMFNLNVLKERYFFDIAKNSKGDSFSEKRFNYGDGFLIEEKTSYDVFENLKRIGDRLSIPSNQISALLMFARDFHLPERLMSERDEVFKIIESMIKDLDSINFDELDLNNSE